MTRTLAMRACRLTAVLALVVATAAAAAALGAGPALAAAPAPAWTIESFATPTNFGAADNARCMAAERVCDAYAITATNAGGAPTDGSSVTLTDTLPPGLTVQRVQLFYSRSPGNDFGGFACSTVPLQCSFPDFFFNFFGPAGPDDTLKMVIDVTVDDPTTSALTTNTATVSGGGAASGSTSETGSINGPAPPFGVSTFTTYLAGIDGQPYAQAGGHPYELTTRIGLTNAMRTAPDGLFAPTAVNDLRDAVIDLPLGFMGSAVAAPTCTLEQISSSEGCPAASVVGRLRTEPKESQDGIESPIYNMVPEHGHAAEFGYVDNLRSSHVMYASVAPTVAGYVLRVTASDIPQVALTGIIASFYGDPATRDATGSPPSAMFTDPSDCSAGPPATTIHVDSWQHPGSYGADGTPNLADPSWVSVSSTTPSVSGCDALHFSPTVSVQPDTTVADSPSGLDFVVAVPQSEDPRTLSTPPLRTARVTLPAGLAVDPSSAGGLAGCAPGQIALGGAGSPTCPEASKIGTVEVTTPLLPKPLSGSVYLATQGENPFHSLLALYVVVDDPETGIVVKIPGEIQLDPASGQVTAVFANAPQFPFSELRLHFKGGSRGVLATPEQCGSFTTTTSLAAWSTPDSGPPAAPGDSFTIGSGCASGFVPSFTAGSADPRAGTYSTFALTFSRSDTDRELSKLSLSLPPGLLARLAGVATCPEVQLLAAARNSGRAELAAPSCPAASQVGTVQVGVGPGPTPLFVPGRVYLTGPYGGGPYGLAVVVPAVAGPFDLGTVLVRSSLHIDPRDAHVTAQSDAFPTIVDGIPVRLRRVDVTIDRPGFTFNPTSCRATSVAGTIASTDGAVVPVSSRFQVANCATLPFTPKFTVLTEARTSKANGAALHVKVTSGPGQANIANVRVDLPKQLPSRLTTLQKACPDATFAANPASCPAASVVGTGTAVTPVLKAPLTGPAYLVSHAGAAFPDLVIVLQGEGITLDLLGNTDIKKGITISSFNTVPDAPISTFDLVLPEGPHSALAAYGNLCKTKLNMPTALTGQNGAVIRQTTRIAVSGCPKHKKGRKHETHLRKKAKHGRR